MTSEEEGSKDMKREGKRRRVLAAFSLLLACSLTAFWSPQASRLTPHAGAAEPLVIAASAIFFITCVNYTLQTSSILVTLNEIIGLKTLREVVWER